MRAMSITMKAIAGTAIPKLTHAQPGVRRPIEMASPSRSTPKAPRSALPDRVCLMSGHSNNSVNSTNKRIAVG